MTDRSAVRGASSRRWKRTWPPLAVGAVLLFFWAGASFTGLLDSSRWPSPPQIGAAAVQSVIDPDFWGTVLATTSTWLIALLVTAALGTILGLVVGNSPLVYRMVIIPVEFLRPIPAVAILPLLLLILGPTQLTVVFLSVYAGFWPMFIQTVYGVRDTDPVLRDTARSFGLTRLQILRRVVLPSALPAMSTGLRLSASISLVLTVTIELIVGIRGLGQQIFLAQGGGQVATMYVLIGVSGILGILVATVFLRLEGLVLHWHQSQRILVKEDA